MPDKAAQVEVALTGVAQVHCIHDVPKRVFTEEQHVREYGMKIGVPFDPKQHKLHKCSCCENLFSDPSDEPRLCSFCQRSPVHDQMAPVPDPTGVVTP